MIRYKPGTFILVPNLPLLSGKPSEMQIIYMWLCSFSDKEGKCFPSRKTLAQKAGCGIKTVDKYLQQLVDDGFITKEVRVSGKNKQNLSNTYTLLLVESDMLEEMDSTSSKNRVNSVQELHDDVVKKNIVDTSENDTMDSGKNDSVTIPNTNNIHKTIISEGKLPDSRGKTYIQRVLSIYADLFRDKYGFSPQINIARFGKSVKELHETRSELQIAALLITFFNWHGMTGQDNFEHDKLLKATFNIAWFFSSVSQYEVYLRNVFKLDFDDVQKVKEFVATTMAPLKQSELSTVKALINS